MYLNSLEEKMRRAAEIEKKLTDSGRFLEGGWESFRLVCLPEGASKEQEFSMRLAFYAGASHLMERFAQTLDDVAKTARNLSLGTQVNRELIEFREECDEHERERLTQN